MLVIDSEDLSFHSPPPPLNLLRHARLPLIQLPWVINYIFHFIKLRRRYCHTLPPSATCTAIKNIFDRSTCQIFTYTHFFIWRPLSFFFLFSLSSAFPFFSFVGHHHHQPPPHRPTKQLKDLVTRSRTPPRLITIAWTIKRCFLSSIGVQMDLVLVLDVSPLHPVIFQRLLGAMMM